ncbi:hypothetical protein WN944_023734 [Citrus x changshan-huyou]|uniref:Uncharacterized protein n=1 Tax=Citrus x changshan-huyou TaxID=2935761 RepID=A0AAP0LME4_9ROSI
MMVHFIFPKVYGDQSAYQVKTERAFNPLGEVVKEYESKHATSEDEGDFEKGSSSRASHKLLFLRIQV